MVVPVCSWGGGRSCFSNVFGYGNSSGVLQSLFFLLLSHFAASAVPPPLLVAHPALSQPHTALLAAALPSLPRAVPGCVSQVEHPSAGKKNPWNLVRAAKVLLKVINPAAG